MKRKRKSNKCEFGKRKSEKKEELVVFQKKRINLTKYLFIVV